MSLTVLYDRECAFCRRCRRWLESEPQLVELKFVPAIRAPYPELANLSREELIVVGDGGEVWRGDEAFITCLWALERYRGWSFRLSSVALRPLARKAFHLLSENRHALSLWRDDEDLATALVNQPEPGCAAGEPGVPRQEVGRRPEGLGEGDVVLVFTLSYASVPLIIAFLLNGRATVGGIVPSVAVLAAAGALVGLAAASVLRRADELTPWLVAVMGGALGLACDVIYTAAAFVLAIFVSRRPVTHLESFAAAVGGGLYLSLFLVAIGVAAAFVTRTWARRVSALND